MKNAINLDQNGNRLLLLSTVEFFLQSYTNQLDKNIFAFHDPMSEKAIKVYHHTYPKDKGTRALISRYKQFRKEILDNRWLDLTPIKSIELSVTAKNYKNEFSGILTRTNFNQLEHLVDIFEDNILQN